jgi:hypothetical protein
MLNFALAASVLIFLIVVLSLSVLAGRRYGRNEIIKNEEDKLEVVTVAEGAVFTLLALLIAFSFSGAYERFEHRKLHMIDEANAIATAYQRISLLAPAAQPELRNDLRQYVDIGLEIYRDAIHFDKAKNDFKRFGVQEEKTWNDTVAAVKLTNDGSVLEMVVTAMNNMFETQNQGFVLMEVHPPGAIFILLIGLAILSGFLVGYTTAETKTKTSLHILSFIAITAFTIYIIVDLEFPRAGMIRVDSFDKIIKTVRHRMDQPALPNTNLK